MRDDRTLRTELPRIRVRSDQLAQWRAAARNLELTLSEWVRTALDDRAGVTERDDRTRGLDDREK